MNITHIKEKLNLELLNPEVSEPREVTGGCVCDLLSWVMARGDAGMAWVTVQTHMNVVAVASLHDFACIIIAENCVMEQDVLNRATEEGIVVLKGAQSAYTIGGMLYELGIR